MSSYIAGALETLPELLALFAPNINSYKRYVSGSWAPTAATWGIENRTTALRAITSGETAIRLENRVPGADVNPYLGFAACLAGGLSGIERNLAPPPALSGNVYEADGLPQLPPTLESAVDLLDASAIARDWLGDAFVDHYVAMRRWEVEKHRTRRYRMGAPPLLRAGVWSAVGGRRSAVGGRRCRGGRRSLTRPILRTSPHAQQPSLIGRQLDPLRACRARTVRAIHVLPDGHGCRQIKRDRIVGEVQHRQQPLVVMRARVCENAARRAIDGRVVAETQRRRAAPEPREPPVQREQRIRVVATAARRCARRSPYGSHGSPDVKPPSRVHCIGVRSGSRPRP